MDEKEKESERTIYREAAVTGTRQGGFRVYLASMSTWHVHYRLLPVVCFHPAEGQPV